MNRRDVIKAAAAGTLITAPGAGIAAAAKRPRPNVLYVFSDQHRAASMPGEPYSQTVAPNLEAFRRANFSMDRCISNYPLCTPYRGIFLSGRWPHQSGLWHNGTTIRRDEISIGRAFRDSGYHTAYVGKWHLQQGADFIPAGPDRQGFEDWYVWERTNNHYTSWTFDPDTGKRIQPKGWTPVLMADQAIDIIKKQTPAKPWMMIVSWNPPHPPYNPPPEDQAIYKPDAFKLRPNVAYPMKGMADAVPALTGEDKLRKTMQGYEGGVTGVDKEFARILKALDDTGQADNTIVVYTSDHGEMMGSQGRMQKQCPFEESVHVPFIVRYPGVTRPSAKSNTLFAAVDIYPTICGLAGLPVPKHCVGRDMSPVMRGEAIADAPAHVFLMNQETDHPGAEGDGPEKGPPKPSTRYVNLPSYRGIRTDTHTYAVADSGRWVLNDNVADPYQLKNLIEDTTQQPLIAQFDKLIAAWLKETGDPFPYAQMIQRVSRYPT